MLARVSSGRRGLVLTTVLGLMVALLTAIGLGAPSPAGANPAGTGLVISEVYPVGGAVGGGTGNPAPFDADFVELYNPTAAPISLNDLSLQYRTGTSAPIVVDFPADDVVAAGGYYLVQMSAPGDNGEPLPAPNLTVDPAIQMNGNSAQVFLANSTTPVPTGQGGNVLTNPAFTGLLVDMVGYGPAGTFEGAATSEILAANESAARDSTGTDTDHNANDFTEGSPTPGSAPVGVTINLLGINDFHGRINATTVKWAGLIEQLTEAATDAGQPTLLVGAGDLIGASEFASSIQEDQPTIDVLNALGLDASAVGNHEFDKGWDDLRNRVIGETTPNAEWEYLGANVYAKGTENPVLPEYAEFDLGGVTVAVVGAVTEETPTLVSPAGITDLDFGDPIDAVNRVAGELSDGNAGNGEADVIVASFHAGAQVGAGSTYAQEIAKGGEFAAMANLDDAVDVIFNGHTHQVYAWDAPIPGGGAGAVRPIVQTGQYADNVGQVTLTFDPGTGEVIAHEARNVERASVTETDQQLIDAYPRVADVSQIVTDALDHAEEVGGVAVGSVNDNITRAFDGDEEDRGAESTLGDLIANALKDGIPADLGEPDLGIVNPGGVRDDLLYEGDTTTSPANTDGVVTYAEANLVLPFMNNIWLVDLTGAELKTVLEQQWQTNPGGPPPSRPFLHLGLSENVQTVLDPDAAAGKRVVSVTIDGEPLDPSATYTVSTFSFLGTGGDNFRAFRDGTSRDTGLIDRDLWISYLEDHPNLSPDFARQQVYASGLPAKVYAGQQLDVSLERLNLTSLGSPVQTGVQVTATDGTDTETLGFFPVADGAAELDLEVPSSFAAGGTLTLTVLPSETTVTVPIGVRTKPTVKITKTPKKVVKGKTKAKLVIRVSDPALRPTGKVAVRVDGKLYRTKTLANGRTQLRLAKFSKPGRHTVKVVYSGDFAHKRAQKSLVIQVKRR